MTQIKCSDIPLVEILGAIHAFHSGGIQTPDESLCHKYPVKVIMAKMEKLLKAGLINYGVSLRTAWLEPKGVEMLEALQRSPR